MFSLKESKEREQNNGFCERMWDLEGELAIRQPGNQIRILRVQFLGNSATILADLAFFTFFLKATFVIFLDKKFKNFRCAVELSLHPSQSILLVKKLGTLEFSAFILKATLIIFLVKKNLENFAAQQSCPFILAKTLIL